MDPGEESVKRVRRARTHAVLGKAGKDARRLRAWHGRASARRYHLAPTARSRLCHVEPVGYTTRRRGAARWEQAFS